MTLHVHRPLAAACATLMAAAVLSACEVNLNTEGLSARETKTFKVAGKAHVVLDTWDGAIEVHSWDRNEVEVEIEKRAMEQALIDQMKVEAAQEGDTITVRVTGPAGTEFRGVTLGVHVSPTSRLRVSVPRSVYLEARSGDGSIRAEGLDGQVVLTTADGRVTASQITGDLKIRSGDGAIRLERVSGTLDLETEDGSIAFDAKPTVLRAKTGDGSIRGEIDFDAVMADNWEIETRDGSVTLRLPTSFNAELDAETRDGSVRASHPRIESGDERREGEGSDERRERRRSLRTKMGEGGKTLRVRTGDGTIRIES